MIQLRNTMGPEKLLDIWAGAYVYRLIQSSIAQDFRNLKVSSYLIERFGDNLSKVIRLTPLCDYSQFQKQAHFILQALDTFEVRTVKQEALSWVHSMPSAQVRQRLIDWIFFTEWWLRSQKSLADPKNAAFVRITWDEAERWFKAELKSFISRFFEPLWLLLKAGLEQIVKGEAIIFPEELIALASNFLSWVVAVEIQRKVQTDSNLQVRLRALVRPEHEAIIATFPEAKFGWGADMEEVVSVLWDSGLFPQTRLSTWHDIKAMEPHIHTSHTDQIVGDTVYRLLSTLDDYIAKQDSATILQKAVEGKLLNSFKVASFRDYIDEKRRFKAQKRDDTQVVRLSRRKRTFRELSDDEAVEHLTSNTSDIKFKQVEDRLFLQQLADDPSLTSSERQAFTLRLAGKTFKEIGLVMGGISKVRAKQLWDSACSKLQKHKIPL